MADIQAPYVTGYFKDPDVFMAAAEASTARGHANHDAYMPYPLHGFDHKLGFKRSWIGKVVLAALLIGAFLGFMLQYYTMKVSWPLVLAGKPFNSWPAFVVVTFECGILSGALTNMFCCLFVACKLLPKPHTWTQDPRLTDDVFALCIPLEYNGSVEDLQRFLTEQGAEDIQVFLPPAAELTPSGHDDRPDASPEEVAHV